MRLVSRSTNRNSPPNIPTVVAITTTTLPQFGSDERKRAAKIQSFATPRKSSASTASRPRCEKRRNDDEFVAMSEAAGAHVDRGVYVAGALYEKGVRVSAVRGVTIAGTLGGVLSGVTAVGNDLTWFGSVGAPSLLVSGLTLAGS